MQSRARTVLRVHCLDVTCEVDLSATGVGQLERDAKRIEKPHGGYEQGGSDSHSECRSHWAGSD